MFHIKYYAHMVYNFMNEILLILTTKTSHLRVLTRSEMKTVRASYQTFSKTDSIQSPGLTRLPGGTKKSTHSTKITVNKLQPTNNTNDPSHHWFRFVWFVVSLFFLVKSSSFSKVKASFSLSKHASTFYVFKTPTQCL